MDKYDNTTNGMCGPGVSQYINKIILIVQSNIKINKKIIVNFSLTVQETRGRG